MNFTSLPVSGRQPRDPRSAPIVFVVDDDVSVRESLELLIYAGGWHPETFESATAFLTRPRADVPSCLILDVSLPDLNGLEVQRRVADDRRDRGKVMRKMNADSLADLVKMAARLGGPPLRKT